LPCEVSLLQQTINVKCRSHASKHQVDGVMMSNFKIPISPFRGISAALNRQAHDPDYSLRDQVNLLSPLFPMCRVSGFIPTAILRTGLFSGVKRPGQGPAPAGPSIPNPVRRFPCLSQTGGLALGSLRLDPGRT
jgi:hypothetical protein